MITSTSSFTTPVSVPVVTPRAAAQADAYFATLDRVEQQLDLLEELSRQLDDPEPVAPAVPAAPKTPYPVPANFLLSVVIPVYNEEQTIVQVIRRVRDVPLPKEILVIDDCSTDGTPIVLRTVAHYPEVRVVRQAMNMGKGAALRRGFAEARGDVVLVQDADLEYSPKDIPRVVEPLVKNRADVVFGSRYLSEIQGDSSWLHRLGNRVLTTASNLLTGLRITDMETCYKAFRRDALRGIRLEQNRFGFEPEITAKIARQKLRLVEVPVWYNPRGYAEGKKIGFKDLISTLYCIAHYGLRRDQRR